MVNVARFIAHRRVILGAFFHSLSETAFDTQPRCRSCGVAGVAKLVDAPDLGSGAARRGGSSPSTRTKVFGNERAVEFVAGGGVMVLTFA